ncbi:UNVERIFIED_CONTAM: hypothetical protein NCL1_31610 [Trichonephila clavipes]
MSFEVINKLRWYDIHWCAAFKFFHSYVEFDDNINWCAKIKDEVEKLAYQLNEEAERTERPIRRLMVVGALGRLDRDIPID